MVSMRRQNSGAGSALKRTWDSSDASGGDYAQSEDEYQDEPKTRKPSSSKRQKTSRASGSKFKSAADYSTSEDDFSEGELQTRKASGSKQKKTAKAASSTAATAKGKTPAKPVRRGKDLSLLPTMPLDILYEILGQLSPKDLVSLSQTNKLWRSTLVSPEAVFVWREARSGYDAPDPPEDFTEQKWARLLFDNACQGCGTKKGKVEIDWYLLRRVCNTRCKRKHLMYEPKFSTIFPGENKGVLQYVPHTYTGVTTKGYWKKSKFYWDVDVSAALDQEKTLQGKQLEEWKADAVRKIEQRDAMVATYKEWSEHMAEMSSSDAKANREKRLKAITQRFLGEGYELVDIERTFSTNTAGIHSGTPHVTNAVWTRLRPQLEIRLVKKRNQRLEAELKPAVEERMNILRELFSTYLDRTVQPSARYYFPPIEVFRPHPDFLGIIEADKDRIITAKDFELIVNNFGKYLTDYQEEKKEYLKELVPKDRRGAGVEHPCNLARHVFRRVDPKEHSFYWSSTYEKTGKMEDDVLVGWPMIATHYYSISSSLEVRPGTFLKMPARFGYNLNVSKISSQLIALAGLDPGTATVQDMDSKNPRFVNDDLETAAGYPVFTWRSALGVSCVLQRNLYRPDESECNFRLATDEEDAEAKVNEELLRPRRKVWSCNHCSRNRLLPADAFTRTAVIEHLRSDHELADPKETEDYFVNERCRHTFEAPVSVVVLDVQKYKCEMASCKCQSIGYRRFTKEKIEDHVKRWSSYWYGNPIGGTHYTAVPSGRDAPTEHYCEL